MRDAFGEALLAQAEDGADFVVLDADNGRSTRTQAFGERFPDRFLNVGCAEQNLVGVAAGIASTGVHTIASTFSVFLCGRAFEQIRNSVCQANLAVTLVGTHAGVTVGHDGPSHFAVEDIAAMRGIPQMRVAVASSDEQVPDLLRLCRSHPGPSYLRLSRRSVRLPWASAAEWQASAKVRDGADVSILACGEMVRRALAAAELLTEDGIEAEVVDLYSVKPLDERAVIDSAAATGAVVVAEEHSRHGGLGEAVAACLGRNEPVPLEQVALEDTFAESGSPAEVLDAFGLSVGDLVEATRRALRRRDARRR
ncbi:MAG TPA: transketolase C-terminal domain-containing protein [Solirubrobacterales bacterium]|nr:transketolase C-terminal domain-containing protein [Solirubrobacterales bacterium]